MSDNPQYVQEHFDEQDRLTAEYEETCSDLSPRQTQRVADATYTYEDMRVAFASGYASCQDGDDADDAWEEHCSFLASTMRARSQA